MDAPEGRLLDNLVGAGEHGRRQVEAERLGRLQVDHQFVLSRSLHRKIGGRLALEDAVDVGRGPPILVGQVRPVGDQAAGRNEDPESIYRGQSVPRCELDEDRKSVV